MAIKAVKEDRDEVLLRAIILQLNAELKLDYGKLAADMGGIKRDAARMRWARYKKKLDDSKKEERESNEDEEDEASMEVEKKTANESKPVGAEVNAKAAKAKRVCQNGESIEPGDFDGNGAEQPVKKRGSKLAPRAVGKVQKPKRSSEEQTEALESKGMENGESDI